MKRYLLAAAMLGLPTCASAVPMDCKSPAGALVPDQATATAIAKAVIAAQQPATVSRRYRLTVEPSAEGAGGWEVSQHLPEPPNRNPKAIEVITGGGGVHLRIDRCTGEISDFYYLR